MPNLQKQNWTKEEELQIVEAFSESSISSLMNIGKDLSQITDSFYKNWAEPLIQMQRNLGSLKIPPTFFDNIVDQGKQISQALESMTIMPDANLISSPLLPSYPEPLESEELELNEDKELELTVTSSGEFAYDGEVLESITLGSKHGKYLFALLTSERNFVNDSDFATANDIGDPGKGIGYIQNDLKKYLKMEGLKVQLKRIRMLGSRLISISPIKLQG